MSCNELSNPSRRRFLELAGGAAAVASGLLAAPASADLPHLTEADPTAQALGYREDTKKVPASKYPKHTAAQECGKCSLFKGASGGQWGPCQIFPGKDVHVHGWCSAFNPRQ